MPGGKVPVYLVQQDQYFDRDQLYGADGKDYIDNCERFVFFSPRRAGGHPPAGPAGRRAARQRLADRPDAGLPEDRVRRHAALPADRLLLTVHNMAYQGQFWHWDMLLTGLDWKYFNWHQMEFHGKLNLLKTGMVFADSINTVSPRYAQEIQSSPLGCGLEGVLQYRRDVLSGILNGIDEAEWNPATDRHLPAKYDADDGRPGQAGLQGGPAEGTGPAAGRRRAAGGHVGRLTDQKGFDLIAEVMQRWVQTSDVQWAILGTGQPKYHKLFESLAERYPQKVAVRLEFSNPLAHRIEAGSDMFLMPSRFEPCGLNQMYSLKYGTVPVVRATGGLADTIFHFKMAGLTDSQLQGYLITEDEGRVLNVFPGSEKLRYTIPFGSPEETIGHLAWLSEQRPGAVCLFGDDGEKFGTWPETKKHVYEDGWLCRFFDALVANQSWIQVTTPAETIDNVPPVGKVYLPDCSYREMTEWALPTEQLVEYERITHEMHDDARLAALRRFVGGGFWRNFKLKYPEADEMYCRMMMVSRRLQEAIDDGATGKLVEQARTQLYRAQCNCGHWHGAFGGIYLPHLRNAVYRVADCGRRDSRSPGQSARRRGSRPRPTTTISTPGRRSAWPTTG